MMKLKWSGLLPVLFPAALLAHGTGQDTPTLQVGASASLSYYSNGAANSAGYWRVPGLLMGGEALPAEQGWHIDDAQLWAQYQLNDATSLHLAVGTHANEVSQDSINLENLFLSYELPTTEDIQFEAGLMETEFAPAHSHHGGLGSFMESSLLNDAFFGRSMPDNGARLEWQVNKDLALGTEVWQGNTFPASNGKGSQDAYLHYQRDVSGWLLDSGAWVMQAKAVQRSDERYFGGHSHAGSLAGTPTDVRFSGDSTLTGGWFDLRSPRVNGVYLGVNYSAGRARSTGLLTDDSTRQASYRSDHLAHAISPYLQSGSFYLAARHEKLSLENYLSGTASSLLAEEANLFNTANPYRNSVQLQWQANSQWLLQAAYTRDHTLPDAAVDDRVSVGLVWEDTLYPR